MPVTKHPRRHALFMFCLAFGAVLALNACAGAPEAESKSSSEGYPVTVENCDRTVTIDSKPERAVTMNQGATEVALALGVEDQMAGTAYMDDEVPERWSEAYNSIDVLSDEYPDKETLLKAEPDLVYASYSSAFGKDGVGPRDELADSGIASYLSPFGCDEAPETATFEDVWQEVTDVAEIFGVSQRADKIVDKQRKELNKLADDDAGHETTIFWYDSGDKTAFAGAGDGGPQLIMDAIGATNIFADESGGWADVSWEKVVKSDPDVIVVADADWSTAEDKIANLKKDPALQKMRAVRDEAFVTVPFSESTPGVRLVDGATHVAEQLRDLQK